MFIIVWIICYYYYNYKIRDLKEVYVAYGQATEKIKNGWIIKKHQGKVIATKGEEVEDFDNDELYELLLKDGWVS